MRKALSLLLALVMVIGMVPMTAFASTADTSSNLAYGKPVKAFLSHDLGNEIVPAANATGTPSMLTDADRTQHVYPGHVYSGFTYDIDLGSDSEGVNYIVTSFVGDGTHGTPKDYKILVKAEADQDWTVVSSISNASNPAGVNAVEHTFDACTVRYIRVSAQETDGRAMFMSEVEVYADPGKVNYARQEGVKVWGRNTITGETIDHTAFPGYESALPEFAVDGNKGNEAIVAVGHRYWDLCLELPEAVQGLNVIKVYASQIVHQLPPSHTILVSEDGLSWIPVFATSNPGQTDYAYTPSVITAEFAVPFPVKYVMFQDDTNAAFMRVAEIELFVDETLDIMVNHALGQPVKAFLSYDLENEMVPAGNANGTTAEITDGNKAKHVYLGNVYSSFAYEVDLGKEVENINTVAASFVKDGGHGTPRDLEILVAGEDRVWKTVAVSSDLPNDEAITTLTYEFPNKAVRYVMVKSPTEVSGRAMFISEIEVYANPDVDIEEKVNLALAEGTTAWGVDTFSGEILVPRGDQADAPYLAENAIDGGYDVDAIPGAGHNFWNLVVKLPEAVEGVNTVKVHGSKTINQLPPNYTILVSNDGVSWMPVKSEVAIQQPTASDYINTDTPIIAQFQPMKVQYVMFRDDTKVNFMRVSELEIYADKDYVYDGLINYALTKDVKVYHGVNYDNGVAWDDCEFTTYPANATGTPSNITDGNKDAHVYPGYIWSRFIYVIDLGEDVEDLNKVVTSFVGDGTHGVPQDYAVSVKAEADAEWEVVSKILNAEQVTGVASIEHTFSNRTARYIRVEGLRDVDGRAMFLSEVEAYADPSVVIPDATAPVVTLSGTAAVDGWNVTEWTKNTNTVAVNVADAEGFTSTVTVNGVAYVAGSDITLTEAGTIDVVVTTSAPGYIPVTNNYTITVPAITDPSVAEINGVGYKTLAEAVAAAKAGDEIVLVDDVEITEAITIAEDKDIALNLGGKKLTLNVAGNYAIVVRGKLAIDGGEVYLASEYGITTSAGNYASEIVINGGNFTSAESGTYMLAAMKGKVVVNGGTFAVPYCVINNFADYYKWDATVEIAGGTFTAEYPLLGSPIAVTGGTFSADPAEYLPKGYVATEADGVWTVEYAPSEKAPLPTVELVAVTEGLVVTDVTAPGADNNYRGKGSVANWQAGDKIAFNVADAEGATSTVTINGAEYVPGTEYTMATDAPLTIVVKTSAEGTLDVVKVYDVTVAKAGKAAIGTVTIELNGTLVELTDLDSTTRNMSDAMAAYIKGGANVMTIGAVAEEGATVSIKMRGQTSADSLTAELPYAAQFTAVVSVEKAGCKTAHYVIDIPVQQAPKAPLDSVVISGIGDDVVVDAPVASARTTADNVVGFVKGETDTITITANVADGLEAVVKVNNETASGTLTKVLPYAAKFTATVTVSGEGYQDAFYVIDFTVAK